MVNERYPGERRGLLHFVGGIGPALEQHCEGWLLQHAARRALATGDLLRLRHARDLFNQLPRELRQQLVASLVHAPARRAAARAPSR